MGDARPTDQAYAVKERLTAAIDEQLTALEGVWSTELPALNAAVRAAEVPAVALSEETVDEIE